MSDFPFGELLADQRWAGKIFNGQWSAAQGGEVAVVEPASARPIAPVGLGNAADIGVAATQAAAALRASFSAFISLCCSVPTPTVSYQLAPSA